MKLLLLTLFAVAPSLAVASQSSPAPSPPGVVIVGWEWSFYSNRLNRRYSSSITADDAAARERREKNRRGATDETAATKGRRTAPDPFVVGPKELEGRPYGFLYKMTVENKGTKAIEALTWEYLFLDPLDRSVVSRHRFSSKVKVTPGKKKSVSGLSVKQPTQVVRAESAELPPVEQVIIKRVEYSDGSVWEQ
ncbi:MAG TPA: hypothetical protein VFX96_05155 [Pyrinomonadaceae bacterium]|nr:hypothetical protein [Pyrinomonadaceae bacterium]